MANIRAHKIALPAAGYAVSRPHSNGGKRGNNAEGEIWGADKDTAVRAEWNRYWEKASIVKPIRVHCKRN